MPFQKVNAINIYFELEGDGHPVVFISGMTMNHFPWKLFQVPAFINAGYQCLVFDNRDCGQTGESPSGYDTAQLAADTVGLMDALGLEKAHIIGYSLGGMIAQQMALNHAEKIRSLVLLGTAAKGDAYAVHMMQAIRAAKNKLSNQDFWTLMSTYVLTWRFHENEELMQRWMGLVTSDAYYQSPASLSRQIDAIMAHDTRDQLSNIKVPTLLITGEEDMILPVRHSEFLQQHIADSKLQLILRCGHSGLSEGVDTFNPAAMAFIAHS
ncbi:MAG: alpha/beta hydrolase [Thiolinea sp.]